MNLFEATIAGGHVAFGGYRLPLPDGALRDRTGPVVVGIRPSDFEDADVWRDESRAVLDVDVAVVEELGADANVIFALDAPPAAEGTGGSTDGDEPGEEAAPLVAASGMTLCTACVDARTQARPGGRVRISVDPARLHFFDCATGEVLETTAPVPAATP